MTVLTVQSVSSSATADSEEQMPVRTGDPTVGVILAHMMEKGGGIQFRLEQASATQGMASNPHVVSA